METLVTKLHGACIGDVIRIYALSFGVNVLINTFVIIASSRTRTFDVVHIWNNTIVRVALDFTAAMLISRGSPFDAWHLSWSTRIEVERARWEDVIACLRGRNEHCVMTDVVAGCVRSRPATDVTFLVRKRFDIPARTIQRAWRSYAQRRRQAVCLIQNAVLQFLYRPGGQRFKGALARFRESS